MAAKILVIFVGRPEAVSMQVANERPEAMQRPVAVVFVADPDAQHLLFKTQPARAKLNPKSKVNQKDFKVHSEGKPRCASCFITSAEY